MFTDLESTLRDTPLNSIATLTKNTLSLKTNLNPVYLRIYLCSSHPQTSRKISSFYMNHLSGRRMCDANDIEMAADRTGLTPAENERFTLATKRNVGRNISHTWLHYMSANFPTYHELAIHTMRLIQCMIFLLVFYNTAYPKLAAARAEESSHFNANERWVAGFQGECTAAVGGAEANGCGQYNMTLVFLYQPDLEAKVCRCATNSALASLIVAANNDSSGVHSSEWGNFTSCGWWGISHDHGWPCHNDSLYDAIYGEPPLNTGSPPLFFHAMETVGWIQSWTQRHHKEVESAFQKFTILPLFGLALWAISFVIPWVGSAFLQWCLRGPLRSQSLQVRRERSSFVFLQRGLLDERLFVIFLLLFGIVFLYSLLSTIFLLSNEFDSTTDHKWDNDIYLRTRCWVGFSHDFQFDVQPRAQWNRPAPELFHEDFLTRRGKSALMFLIVEPCVVSLLTLVTVVAFHFHRYQRWFLCESGKAYYQRVAKNLHFEEFLSLYRAVIKREQETLADDTDIDACIELLSAACSDPAHVAWQTFLTRFDKTHGDGLSAIIALHSHPKTVGTSSTVWETWERFMNSRFLGDLAEIDSENAHDPRLIDDSEATRIFWATKVLNAVQQHLKEEVQGQGRWFQIPSSVSRHSNTYGVLDDLNDEVEKRLQTFFKMEGQPVSCMMLRFIELLLQCKHRHCGQLQEGAGGTATRLHGEANANCELARGSVSHNKTVSVHESCVPWEEYCPSIATSFGSTWSTRSPTAPSLPMSPTSHDADTVHVNDSVVYFKRRSLGTGRFGKVYEGERIGVSDAEHRQFVAVKVIPLDDDGDSTRDERFMMKCVHPNIVQFYTTAKLDTATGDMLCIVMERGKFSLEDDAGKAFLRDLDRYGRCEIMHGVMKGLRYLHDFCSMAHNDIKPANVLMVDGSNQPKLCDFGLGSHAATASTSLTLVGGTIDYMAPEVKAKMFQGASATASVTLRADIFSAGVLFQYVVDHGPNRDDLAADIIKMMRSDKPKDRPTASMCLEHPVFMSPDKQMKLLNAVDATLRGKTPVDPDAIEVKRQLLIDVNKSVSDALGGDRKWTHLLPFRVLETEWKGCRPTRQNPPEFYEEKGASSGNVGGEMLHWARNMWAHAGEIKAALDDNVKVPPLVDENGISRFGTAEEVHGYVVETFPWLVLMAAEIKQTRKGGDADSKDAEAGRRRSQW
jgi:hypothetical protein